MHFLKTLFWVVLTVIAVIFSLRNWVPVSINLWAGLTADVKLPVLIVIGMLIGFAPTYAVHRTRMWRLHRRIDTLERNALQTTIATPLPRPLPDAAPGEATI